MTLTFGRTLGDVATSANCCGLALCLEYSRGLIIVFVIILKMGVAMLSVRLLKGWEVGTGTGAALTLRNGGTVECLMIVFLVVVLWCSLLDKVISETILLFKV